MSFEGQTKILWEACKNYSRGEEMTKIHLQDAMQLRRHMG
jgi:hypothetical protein